MVAVMDGYWALPAGTHTISTVAELDGGRITVRVYAYTGSKSATDEHLVARMYRDEILNQERPGELQLVDLAVIATHQVGQTTDLERAS